MGQFTAIPYEKVQNPFITKWDHKKVRFNQEKARFNGDEYNFNGINQDLSEILS